MRINGYCIAFKTEKSLESKGPIPEPGSNLFKGMVFILTHAVKSTELMKLEKRLIQQSPVPDLSTDESSMEGVYFTDIYHK